MAAPRPTAPSPTATAPRPNGGFATTPGRSPVANAQFANWGPTQLPEWGGNTMNPFIQVGGGPQPATSAAAAPAAISEFSSHVEDNPDLRWLADKFKSRFDTSNTKRAIDASNLGIMDAAALGAADAKGAMASRGVLGTGTGASFLNKRIFAPAQRAAAGAAKDIALDEQHRLDALTLGGLGIMKAPSDLALGQNAQALQQWMAANGFNIQNAQLAAGQQAQNFAQQQQQWQNMLQLMQQGNPYASGSVAGSTSQPRTPAGGWGPR